MTPAELNKKLTALLNSSLAEVGFSQKCISCLHRKIDNFIQKLSFYFTRGRGLPGEIYTLTCARTTQNNSRERKSLLPLRTSVLGGFCIVLKE